MVSRVSKGRSYCAGRLTRQVNRTVAAQSVQIHFGSAFPLQLSAMMEE